MFVVFYKFYILIIEDNTRRIGCLVSRKNNTFCFLWVKVNDKQTLHSKLMIKPHYVLRKGKLFLLHNATCRDTLVTNPVIKYEI
jgi:hypothetical protein